MGSIMGSVSMQSAGIARAERLSALIDGESAGDRAVVSEHDLTQFLSEFGEADRALWAEYHLVGDVLKSEDLVAAPAADRAFLIGFSAALESEPALLAPRALKPNRAALQVRRYMPTLAAVAAVVTLTWILVPRQMHGGVPGAAEQTAANVANTVAQTQVVAQAVVPGLAQAGGSSDVRRVAMAASTPDTDTATPAPDDVNMIRDAQLDQYLDAHQQFAQRPVPQDVPMVRVVSDSQEQ